MIARAKRLWSRIPAPGWLLLALAAGFGAGLLTGPDRTDIIAAALAPDLSEAVASALRGRVEALTTRFPLYPSLGTTTNGGAS